MASNNNRLTPRQKMINLMYIVLTAMLALNVSSDVLNGFKQVEDGLKGLLRMLRCKTMSSTKNWPTSIVRIPKKEDRGTKNRWK